MQPIPSAQGHTQVAIIGAGFSGLAMGRALKAAGITDFTLFERAGGVGGTWRDNTYPGAACDVPSWLYSYSFAQQPGWPRFFSGQEEILAYIERCADTFGLRPHIRFNQPIETATWSGDRQRWILTGPGGARFEAQVVVCANGGLSNPKRPAIPGLERFSGTDFHTARWDHSHDLKGRRVAIVGTGASAIQVIPQIAPLVAHLDVYQRTPAWVVPRPDRDVKGWERWILEHIPGAQTLARQAIYWTEELMATALLREGSMTSGLEALARWNLRRAIEDPALRARLTPDYRLGCKRMLLANDFYPALTRPNVDLITAPIREVTPDGVLCEDGINRPVDTLIWATGFDVPLNGFPIQIEGRGGRTLDHVWAEGAEAYRGIMVAGFPNLFLTMGPNTGPGHTSVLVYVEAQVDFILGAIQAMKRGGIQAVDVRDEAQQAFNHTLRAKMAGTVWVSGCKSWYQSKGGENTALWPGYSFQYRRATRRFDLAQMRTWPEGGSAASP